VGPGGRGVGGWFLLLGVGWLVLFGGGAGGAGAGGGGGVGGCICVGLQGVIGVVGFLEV